MHGVDIGFRGTRTASAASRATSRLTPLQKTAAITADLASPRSPCITSQDRSKLPPYRHYITSPLKSGPEEGQRR